MQRFSELSETSARRIDRAIMGMARLESLEALEVRFLQEAGKLLPADCLCWNNWAPDLSHLISFRNNDSHMEPFEKLLPVFSETVQYHPVIVANQFAATTEQVTRLSDFESGRRF